MIYARANQHMPEKNTRSHIVRTLMCPIKDQYLFYQYENNFQICIFFSLLQILYVIWSLRILIIIINQKKISRMNEWTRMNELTGSDDIFPLIF